MHTFDCTVGTPDPTLIPTGVVFHNWCIGGVDEVHTVHRDGNAMEGQFYTLPTIRAKLGHGSISMLKMDIERYEFAVIAGMERESAPRQIAFETHLLNYAGEFGGPVSEREWNSMWAALDAMGYEVFDYEVNPWYVCCCEFSIMRPA